MNIKYVTLFFLMSLISIAQAGQKNKVAQSGMTYLAISMSARENAMGDASTASVKGIQGIWHNPSVLADVKQFAVALNQVNWLVDTKLYGAAFAYSLGNWGTVGLDVTYMDWGEIQGTRRVDRSVNYKGFVLTGDIGVEDYAIGVTYARRINDRFSLGFKIKRLHEDLGRAAYAINEYDDPETGKKVRTYNEKNWLLNDWGFDFGTVYDVGWRSLTFAMTMQNFSRDMKYFYEEFSAPMVLRMGFAMDITEIWDEGSENMDVNIAVDALHPNDHTESVHVGSELVINKQFALRGGYKFNHGVESATFGLGVVFEFAGTAMDLNYAYGTAKYFKDLSRLSMQFTF